MKVGVSLIARHSLYRFDSPAILARRCGLGFRPPFRLGQFKSNKRSLPPVLPVIVVLQLDIMEEFPLLYIFDYDCYCEDSLYMSNPARFWRSSCTVHRLLPACGMIAKSRGARSVIFLPWSHQSV
jgi:hypothetical protein